MYDLGSYRSNKMGMTIRNKTCLKHMKLTSQLVLLVVGLRLSSLVLKLYGLTFLNNGMVMSVWDTSLSQYKKTGCESSTQSQAHRGTGTSCPTLDCKLLQDIGYATIHVYTSMSSSTAMHFFCD